MGRLKCLHCDRTFPMTGKGIDSKAIHMRMAHG